MQSLTRAGTLGQRRLVRVIATVLTPQTTSRRRTVHVGVKSNTTPDPIEPVEAQSQPLGNYYEYILQSPQPIPEVKLEQPPASAAEGAKEAASKKEAA